MSKKIVMYTTSWCGDCRNLKNQLRDNGILYEERDIEQNAADYATMMGYTNGKRVIPTLEIEGKILINPRFADVQKEVS